MTATVTPYPSIFGTAGFTKASVAASAYYAVDEDANYIIAGRAGFGSIFGETGGLAAIPANYRFYEGGLATIRGYRYQTVGPSTPLGYTIEGLSGFNATLEARIKVMDNIGVAPFFDIGGAVRGSLPFSGGGDTRMAAGIGLLYYTPLSTPTSSVSIGKIDGVLSSDATIRDLKIADRDGVWVTVNRIRIVWRRLALLQRRREIDRLDIDQMNIARKPIPSETPVGGEARPGGRLSRRAEDQGAKCGARPERDRHRGGES